MDVLKLKLQQYVFKNKKTCNLILGCDAYRTSLNKSYLFIRSNIIIIFFATIYFSTINITDCATQSSNISPQQTLEDLVNNVLTERELMQFNEEFAPPNMGQRIAIAIGINLLIYGIVYYGPSIVQSTLDFITNLPHNISQIWLDAQTSLFETARDMALRNIVHANQETRNLMLQRALQIVENRIPPSA